MKAKEKDIAEKLKKEFASRSSLKFDLKKEPGGSHLIVLNSPVEIRSEQNCLCDLFGLECNRIHHFYVFKANTNYTSKNILNIMYPFSLIEWHCNIVEHSHTVHDDNPHLHKEEDLLHISFVSNNFYENPV